MKLTKKEKKAIKKECGIAKAKVIRTRRDSHGYPDRLLEGKDHSGVLFRGWLREGEGIRDIRWDTENVDGWPANLE